MTEYDNTNRGSIWRNEKKEKDTHPDFTGSLNVAGVEYWVSAWKRKEGAAAKAPALSFSVKPKDEQPARAGNRQGLPDGRMSGAGRDQISSGRHHDVVAAVRSQEMDDDIPF